MKTPAPVDLREIRRGSFPEHTLVVLDTSVIMKDWFLRGAGFHALRAACSLIRADIVIPDVLGKLPQGTQERRRCAC
jgi:hypothetical protein